MNVRISVPYTRTAERYRATQVAAKRVIMETYVGLSIPVNPTLKPTTPSFTLIEAIPDLHHSFNCSPTSLTFVNPEEMNIGYISFPSPYLQPYLYHSPPIHLSSKFLVCFLSFFILSCPFFWSR